ncbi:MAG: bifunctional methylenetetrahydrofolate dehydrogenase/methenyltetrahydrofolate cyclohydrolase FolD [Anaerotignum sp.]|jgi:methylenetetrahydrofolate dehydrogenase (NADP+)/methenyltetrahydrofolate cyclohydrolase|nr:bifunctional methylenetetrahydrofolate dehydrogenase/methenyltetrahydrofolate cyclohydrolase FolD [Anaerotignum sp.]MCI8868383.1 bifunctional methylenetetrahydrofolate dehydrogenase/methenyltetrahydrofolate cyclohydrolase FolD [Anaerotignum sp.]
MAAERIDGKAIADEIKKEAAAEAAALKAQGIEPCLAVILVGNDSASQVYVNNKKKACEAVGIRSVSYTLDENAEESELLQLVDTLNLDSSVHGILVQLPLPEHMDETKVIVAISPEKDVDCFHPMNVGRLTSGLDGFLPCTPAGVIEILKRTGHDIAGKNCAIIGRSNLVGKPLALLMTRENATVTLCHSKTQNLAEVCRRADILVSAAGKAGLVTGDMVKDGAVVIDVGMNRNAEGKLCGDVVYDEAAEKASAVTPVPGGVGLMTVAMLMKNCIRAAKKVSGM